MADAVELATAYSCEPFTACLLVSFTAPSATPSSTRAPAVPVKSTVVPSVPFATVMLRVVASCCTRPIEPLLIWLLMSLIDAVLPVMSGVFFVTRPSRFEIASPALFTVVVVPSAL
ncbi:hypothetical protein AWB71_04200 [Caballeronia peredens]|nr:hypothetical protein AWB71_04200 [Caballeronia peredens]